VEAITGGVLVRLLGAGEAGTLIWSISITSFVSGRLI
jgi:hypothetical protein